MKKLSNKIMCGLKASFIGLLTIMGTQVYAMFDGAEASQNQSKPIASCSEEELSQRLPNLWERFFNAKYDACNSAYNAVYNAAGSAAMNTALEARHGGRRCCQ